jgi:peptide/nickel transport system substrate-binding protein
MPIIPTLFRSAVTAVNNRVTNFSVDPKDSSFTWSKVGVSSNTPDAE